MMPPKLVRLAANYLAGPLSQSIDNSIKIGLFPENAKVSPVTPIDKKTDKNSVKMSSNKCFKLLLKILRKYTKNTTRGKNEQSNFLFYLCVKGIVQHAACAYKTY